MSTIFNLIENNDIKGVKHLIESKIDLNQKDDFGQGPLHIAVNCECFDIIELLIMEGADLNLTDDEGNTPMSMISSYDSRIFKMLLEYGADPNIKNNTGRRVLDAAIDENVPEVIELLQSYGAKSTISPKDYD